jgi:hypothetical protein
MSHMVSPIKWMTDLKAAPVFGVAYKDKNNLARDLLEHV